MLNQKKIETTKSLVRYTQLKLYLKKGIIAGTLEPVNVITGIIGKRTTGGHQNTLNENK